MFVYFLTFLCRTQRFYDFQTLTISNIDGCKMKMSNKTCCFKECEIKDLLDSRIEVKTVIPKSGFNQKVKKNFVVNWHQNGEADFHIECWEKILSRSKSRSTKRSVSLTKEEKALIDVASEAPEQFDSNTKILLEARRAADWIKSSKHCVAFTGAGISTSAGIGDYRGKAGKWTEEDQNNSAAMTTVLAGTQHGDEPSCKKRKLETRDESQDEDTNNDQDVGDDGVPYEKLRPTYTHEALKKLMEAGYLKHIISQNGDGLHGLSGIPDEDLSELHGNVFIEVCEKCERRYNRKFYVMDDLGSQYFEEIEDYGISDVKKPKYAVKCELCGLSHRTGRRCETKGCNGYLKDTIINFRDLLEGDILAKARTQSRRCDVMLCLGTTLQVTPASALIKKRNNRNKLIICNRQETPVDHEMQKKGPDGAPAGCRVFGDCDKFMKEVMKHIFPSGDMHTWEAKRPERMKEYDQQRDIA